jgi:serine/threonine-protein kinase
MATVFAARDLELRRDVAVKVLFPHLARSREVVSRFHREARAAAGLDHRHILRVLDVGGGVADADPEAEVDPPYIVLELVRGANLAESMTGGAPILAEVVAAIGVALAAALGEAHRAGIVHRDVKPANLLLAEGGRLVLADFGVARVSEEDSLVTRTGTLLGTPAFMSPEQATGGELDARSDLYSMGATLYQLATGSLPVTGGPAKAVAAILAGEVTPPLRRNRAMGAGLAKVIERLMQLEPDARYRSAAEVEAALRGLLAESEVGADADAVVAEWAADRAACEQRLAKVALASTVRLARAAAEAGQGPRALALCDRALALDGACAEAMEIAARVGRRGRGGRVALFAAVAVTGLGAAGFWILGEKSPDARRRDAGAVAAATPEPEPEPEPEADAETDSRSVPEHELEHEHEPRRPIAVKRPVAPDAGGTTEPVVTIDAAPPVPAKPGTLSITADTWCDLTIDGAARGRIDQTEPRSFEVAAGRHDIVCASANGLRWKTSVEVASGKRVSAAVDLIHLVRVMVDVSGPSARVAGKVVRDGGSIELLQGGPYRVVVGTSSKLIQVPPEGCTIRDTPQVDCY